MMISTQFVMVAIVLDLHPTKGQKSLISRKDRDGSQLLGPASYKGSEVLDK